MGEMQTIRTPDGEFGAYVARPAAAKAPAIVVIQEIFGVNAVMRAIADDFAAEGYLAVCPDLFWRIEPGIDITDHSEAEWKKAFELYNAFDVDLGVKDIAAAIANARQDAGCSGKVGSVGFCLGGLLAFLSATRTDVDAAVGYYGVGIEKHLAETDMLNDPLLLHIAEEDQFVPKEAQALIVASLKNHRQVDLFTYPGRDHAFARNGGEHYDATDAALARGRTLDLFKKALIWMLAIQATRAGGPEVLEAVEVPTPAPGPGQVLVRHEAIGLNFIDTYQRSGLYPMRYPVVLGQEAAGVVEAVGEGVTSFKAGERVVYSGQGGAYAEYQVVPAARLLHLPDGVSFEVAAASLLKGMTTEFLVRRCYPLRAGETILLHAAAGGVGTLLTQWAKAIGATVIGTVGSPQKAALAKQLGCDHVILYREEDVAVRVKEITGGAGVPVAYDAVGKDTFEGTMASLGRRGLFVSFGNASGPAPAFEPLRLMRGGSLFFTRPTMADYTATRADLEESAGALLAMLASGKLHVEIGQRFKLADARKAHEALEGRETIGATVLLP